jgi:hypothetical protein
MRWADAVETDLEGVVSTISMLEWMMMLLVVVDIVVGLDVIMVGILSSVLGQMLRNCICIN